MKSALLIQRPCLRTGLLALAGALSATACGFETIESVPRREQAGPEAQASAGLGVTNYGVPPASEVDFGKSPPVTTSDMTY